MSRDDPAGAGFLPAFETVFRGRVLYADGSRVYAGRGLELFLSEDGGRSFSSAGQVNAGLAARLLARLELPSRFLRSGFHGLQPLPDGSLLAIVRGAILRRGQDGDAFEQVHEVARGTRPLNLCLAPGGRVYFGEYFQNRSRNEVHVFGSDDGLSWSVVHSFPPGTVRHVHGVFHDPWRGGEWVLTGDEGPEVGLWLTTDGFRTLEPVVRGVQEGRAVSVIPVPRGLIVPMDSPQVQNHIQLLDVASGHLEPVAELPGSAFHAARAGPVLLVSTTVERSRVNLDPRAALFASLDSEHWRPVARFERDLAFLGDRRGYLQYPTLVLPSGANPGPWVFASGQALRGLHGRLLRWRVDELTCFLTGSAEVTVSLRRA